MRHCPGLEHIFASAPWSLLLLLLLITGIFHVVIVILIHIVLLFPIACLFLSFTFWRVLAQRFGFGFWSLRFQVSYWSKLLVSPSIRSLGSSSYDVRISSGDNVRDKLACQALLKKGRI